METATSSTSSRLAYQQDGGGVGGGTTLTLDVALFTSMYVHGLVSLDATVIVIQPGANGVAVPFGHTVPEGGASTDPSAQNAMAAGVTGAVPVLVPSGRVRVSNGCVGSGDGGGPGSPGAQLHAPVVVWSPIL